MARNEMDTRIAPLGSLRDFEVAEGYPDIRGWRVDSTDGVEVGRVHELLVDVDVMRTRYLDVRLTSEIAATPGDRDVLVPIGAAQLDDKADRVVLPLHAERVGLLPPYGHGALTRAHEYEVRRHFSLGEAAAAAGTVAATKAGANAAPDAAADERAFYDDQTFDDRRFFSTRRPVGDTAGEKDVRIPVSPEDSVILKRGDGGRDEIIIRKPVDKNVDSR